MFSSVSWQQFFTTLFILLFIYYFLVLVIYFRKDLLYLSKNGLTKKQPVVNTKATHTTGDDNTLLFSTVHDLMEELKSVFHSAARNDYPKEELLMALQVKLRDYPMLKETPFRVSINNHIEQESKDKCQVILTDTDVRNIW